MVKTRKTQQANAGGRSGVVIEKIDDSNVDVDGWFDSARSPDVNSKHNASSSSQEEPSINDEGRVETKKSKKKTVKTQKRRVNMALTGATLEDDSEEERDSISAKKYAAKLKRKGGTGMNFTSPSDLSRVSTAPFSPSSEGRNEREEEEKSETDAKSNQEDDSEIENALLTQQERNEETDIAEENDVIARQSTKGNTANLEVASPEVDFPVDGDEDEEANEDDGDDLGPPVLPDDFSDDEEQEQGQPSETKKANDNDIAGLDSDDEKNNSVGVSGNDYDDHDDDDEGPGFNMVNDPETPLTVREDRAKKEMKKIRGERKKQKNNTESESDDDNDDGDEEDSKSTPKIKRSKKHKKKKKRDAVFSPKGIPIANRDYESVPIGALVEDSPDEDGPRRSRRAKVKPLQFWRGEKMEFGAHNEHGYIGKAFGDMPVVTGIQKALPTPYKKRKPSKNNSGPKKGARKHASSDARGSGVEEEYNSKKLRRKYKYHDGEEAYLWDDVTDDTADQSKISPKTSRAHFVMDVTLYLSY